eukprot:scaffold54947_cov55-Phaeocystis_antarctica.AAC.1
MACEPARGSASHRALCSATVSRAPPHVHAEAVEAHRCGGPRAVAGRRAQVGARVESGELEGVLGDGLAREQRAPGAVARRADAAGAGKGGARHSCWQAGGAWRCSRGRLEGALEGAWPRQPVVAKLPASEAVEVAAADGVYAPGAEEAGADVAVRRHRPLPVSNVQLPLLGGPRCRATA